jgi:hypothetical protein
MLVGQNNYNMKVAVLLTGHCRNFDKSFESLKKNVLDKYDCDVYFNTWNTNEPSLDRGLNVKFNIPQKPFDIQPLIEKYKPYLKNYNFENYDDYINNRFVNISFLDRDDDVFKTNERAIQHGSFWVERLRDQWWMVKKGWDLIDNPYSYDIIFRIRFDLSISNIEFKKAKFVVPKSEVEFYKIGTHWSDHMAYGEPDSMDKYCHMFDSIETLYTNHNIDISHAEVMSEFYMRHYGNKSEVFIDLDINYNKI